MLESYSFEKYTSSIAYQCKIIINEINEISVPAYIYFLRDCSNSKEYGIITDMTIPYLPLYENEDCAIVATTRRIYKFNYITETAVALFKLDSPCWDILRINNKVIVLSECDLYILDNDFNLISKMNFDDIIIDCAIEKKSITLCFFEKEKFTIPL